MKSLITYIQEKLVLGKNTKNKTYHPQTWDELRQIVEQRFKELGPGTENEPINFNDIDVSEIDTFYNESDNMGIFDITNFEYIDVSDWNVSNVKDMSWTFSGCFKLKSVGDLSNWDVSNVKDMKYMFYECYNLKSIGDISSWNVSNVKDMKWMFAGCEKLKSIGDLSNWKISNVKNMEIMFDKSGIINRPSWYKE